MFTPPVAGAQQGMSWLLPPMGKGGLTPSIGKFRLDGRGLFSSCSSFVRGAKRRLEHPIVYQAPVTTWRKRKPQLVSSGIAALLQVLGAHGCMAAYGLSR